MTSEEITIRGKPYLLASDEIQAGTRAQACANGTPLFAFGRIIDISDVTRPFTVSKLKLEVDDPKNCAALANDLGFQNTFGYSAHYCTADNRDDLSSSRAAVTRLAFACSTSRIPPTEIAYYKPPIQTGENIPDRASNDHGSHLRLDKSHSRFLSRNGHIELWTTSADNGFQVLKFAMTSCYPAPCSRRCRLAANDYGALNEATASCRAGLHLSTSMPRLTWDASNRRCETASSASCRASPDSRTAARARDSRLPSRRRQARCAR